MSRMVNFRVEDDLATAIDNAAIDHGVSKSVWLREVAAKAVGMKDATEAHPARSLELQASRTKRLVARNGCTHPPTARTRMPFTTVCTLCGSSLSR